MEKVETFIRGARMWCPQTLYCACLAGIPASKVLEAANKLRFYIASEQWYIEKDNIYRSDCNKEHTSINTNTSTTEPDSMPFGGIAYELGLKGICTMFAQAVMDMLHISKEDV